MKHLTLLFLLLTGPLLTAQTDTPCPAGDCPCMLQKADNLAQNPATFSKALNYYFAVTACDENLRDEVEIQIEALFVRIEQLRKNEEKANRTARMALQDANAARVTSDSLYRVAEVQRKKAEDVLNRIYFYKDRFGLAYREGKYGFIDADLTEKIPFKYEEALPFDESGFARVKRRNKNDYSAILDFLIDTLGTEYRVSSDYEELTPDIVALDLRNLGMDSLPAAVWKHTPLKILLLNSNDLHKLPDSIGRLTNLFYLDLRGTRLSSVPKSIGRLTQLTTLDLSANYLNAVPPEIGRLTQLTDLDLFNNHIDSLPDEIWNLTGLTRLNLSYNLLKKLPDQITRLTQLTDLNLNQTLLTRLPENMDAFANLQKLDIGKNKLTELPASITKLSHLSEFDLYLNEIQALPPDFGKLTQLTYLDISQNQIAELPAGFGNLTRLTLFDAYENDLTQIPQEIRQLKSLQELKLDKNPVSEEDIARLRTEMPWCKISWEQMEDDELLERHFYPQAYVYQLKQVAENPEDVDLYPNLIIYAFLAGKPEEGRKASKKAMEMGIDEQSTDLFLAVGYLVNNQWDEFEKLYLKWKDVRYERRPSMTVTDGMLRMIDLLKESKVNHPDFERAEALLKE